MDSRQLSIKVDVAQAFVLDRHRLGAPVGFNVVEQSVHVTGGYRLEKKSKALSVGIRPYKMDYMLVAQLFEDLHLFQVFLRYLPSQRNSLPRKLVANDFRLVDIAHCTPAEKSVWQ